jgi:hypothetical protein
MLRRMALVRTDVSKELSASIIRLTRIGELGTLAVTSNRCTYVLNFVLFAVQQAWAASKGFSRWAMTLRFNGFLGQWPLSGILNTRKRNVSETRSVSVFRGGEGNLYSVGSLRKSSPQSLDTSPHLWTGSDPVSYTHFRVLQFRTKNSVHKPSNSEQSWGLLLQGYLRKHYLVPIILPCLIIWPWLQQQTLQVAVLCHT